MAKRYSKPKVMKYMKKDAFFNLTMHNKIKLRYMVGTAVIVKGPYIKSGNNCVDVKFKDGVWNDGKIRSIIQQQISP